MNNIIAMLLVFASLPLAAASLSPQLQKEIQDQKPKDVLVYFKEQSSFGEARGILDRDTRVHFVVQSLRDTALKTQAPVIEILKKWGVESKSYFSTNALFIRQAPVALIEELASLAEVRQIGSNVHSKLNLPFPLPPLPPLPTPPSDPIPEPPKDSVGQPSFIAQIEAERVWKELGVRGEGIVIAGQDTGYFVNHEALKKKYRGYQPSGGMDHDYHWHDGITNDPCSPGGTHPCDDKDHGTHTMGTMVGDDENGNRIGVAPGAQWIGCRNMKDGIGTIQSYLECFDFFLAPFPIGGSAMKDGRPELAPHIVNNSWSCPRSEGCTGDEFYQVVQAYKAAGILLVAAAGNDGDSCGSVSNQPGLYAGELMAVGAWNSILKEIAFFSGRGPSPWNNQLAPNIIAPGTLIDSALASGVDHYGDKAGTSMASPQVAGAAALLWSYRPELIGQIETTISILQASASPMPAKQSCPGFPGSQTPNAVHGYGMLNVYRALTLAP